MDGGKGHAGHLARFEEMVEVGNAIGGACGARAPLFNGAKVVFVFAVAEFEGAVFGEDNAMARGFCGVGAVEGVDAKRDAPLDRGKVADAKEVVGLFFGKHGHGVGEHVDHLFLAATSPLSKWDVHA
mgnify:CR=1 FL=1